MKLLYDDESRTWFWVSKQDLNETLSPDFVIREEALDWLDVVHTALHNIDIQEEHIGELHSEQDASGEGFYYNPGDSLEELDNCLSEPFIKKPNLNGGAFKNPKELLPAFHSKNLNMKPDHPDLEEDSVPTAVKSLVGQARMNLSTGETYEVCGIAGPRKTDDNDHYSGRWFLYIKDLMTQKESVKNIEVVLQDANYPKEGITNHNLTDNLLELAKKHKEYREDNNDGGQTS